MRQEPCEMGPGGNPQSLRSHDPLYPPSRMPCHFFLRPTAPVPCPGLVSRGRKFTAYSFQDVPLPAQPVWISAIIPARLGSLGPCGPGQSTLPPPLGCPCSLGLLSPHALRSLGWNCFVAFCGDLLRPKYGRCGAGPQDTFAHLQLDSFVLGSLSGAA